MRVGSVCVCVFVNFCKHLRIGICIFGGHVDGIFVLNDLRHRRRRRRRREEFVVADKPAKTCKNIRAGTNLNFVYKISASSCIVCSNVRYNAGQHQHQHQHQHQ